MKTLFATLAFLLLTVPLYAATINLAWDAKTVGDTRTHVRIYERTGAVTPYTYTLVATAIEPATTVTVPSVTAGTHTYVARGWNGQSESADSNAVSAVILALPGVIQNVTITITP
jgi:hypothetical protein